MTNLNDQQFYHGTANKIEGDEILPAVVHGKGSYWGGANSGRGEAAKDFAWAHPNEQIAWNYAGQGSALNRPERPAVYEVKGAHGDVTPGGDLSVKGEVKSPTGLGIVGRKDIAPGRQGTFPEVNWHQFSATNAHGGKLISSWDANHPNDEAIKYGHDTLYKAGIEDSPGTQENTYYPGDADNHMQEKLRQTEADKHFSGGGSTARFMHHQATHHATEPPGTPKLFNLTRESRKKMQDPHKGDSAYQMRVRKENEKNTEWDL